jgi:hypothetical protein
MFTMLGVSALRRLLPLLRMRDVAAGHERGLAEQWKYCYTKKKMEEKWKRNGIVE